MWGGGGEVQTSSTQSAKICSNLNFQGGVQTDSTQCAKIDLSKSEFFLGGEVVVVQTNSTQSAKICPNLHFQCGGGV